MTNQKLFDLLIEIRDSDIFAPTKYDYGERGIDEPMKLAHAYNLIEEFGNRGGNYRLTKNGYAVIDSNGDLSVLDSPSISIRPDNGMNNTPANNVQPRGGVADQPPQPV